MREREASYRRAVTINGSAETIYATLCDPHAMQHVLPGELSLQGAGDAYEVSGIPWAGEMKIRVSRRQPAKIFEWEASLPYAEFQGEVELSAAPGDRGTEVHAFVYYRPTAPLPKPGLVSRAAIQLGLRQTLNRLRAYLETGEVPTTAGQPSGRKSAAMQRLDGPQRKIRDKVARPGLSETEPHRMEVGT